jgi:hypothetical protein
MFHNQAKFLGLCSYVSRYSWGWTLEIFNLGGVLLSCAGFVWLFIKGKRNEFLFLLAWFLSFQLFNGNITCSNPRYLVIGWIPLVISEGFFLGNFRKSTGFYVALVVIFYFAIISFIQYAPVLEFRHRRALQVEFAQWVSVKTPKNSLILVRDEGAFIKYFGHRDTSVISVDISSKDMSEYLAQKIDVILREDKPVYIISSVFDYDRFKDLKRELSDHYEVVCVGLKKNEDWHHELLDQYIFKEWLLQIKRKP